MSVKNAIAAMVAALAIVVSAFHKNAVSPYTASYNNHLLELQQQQAKLNILITITNLKNASSRIALKKEIENSRRKLKALDFWLRYFEPNAYRKINGPLPVEWESEVFEKFEKPYRREGGGLYLAEAYLSEETANKDSLQKLITASLKAIEVFKEDSITRNLETHDHFFLCNRLYLLNLAAIYTTGYENPNSERIIPELSNMLSDVNGIYRLYNEAFPKFVLTEKYLLQYNRTIDFVKNQPTDIAKFDHYTFIKDYVNILFAINQQMIKDFDVKTNSYNDYTLNNSVASIFDGDLFFAQNTKGIYSRVNDEAVLKEIDSIGKLLFYDPILSGNNKRSCASCHKPTQYFTDTTKKTAMQFDKINSLPRNTPSLINADLNHLLMLDGKHLNLTEQATSVITNPIEMGANEEDVLNKVLSCSDYKNAFKKYLKYTPQKKEVTLEHIVSAISFYYGKYSKKPSAFDESMNYLSKADNETVKGFNLFMGKAQCSTCHFVPSFSGIKPPYIGNEFEVIGVPADIKFTGLSNDSGRHRINPANETLNAFRTITLRNSAYTKPYMHNGVFRTLKEVIDFYDAGGGIGKRMRVNNQTLSADSLHLSETEKKQLTKFIHSLNEKIKFESAPIKLPVSKDKSLNERKVGGEY